MNRYSQWAWSFFVCHTRLNVAVSTLPSIFSFDALLTMRSETCHKVSMFLASPLDLKCFDFVLLLQNSTICPLFDTCAGSLPFLLEGVVYLSCSCIKMHRFMPHIKVCALVLFFKRVPQLVLPYWDSHRGRLLHFFFAEWARIGRPAKVSLGGCAWSNGGQVAWRDEKPVFRKDQLLLLIKLFNGQAKKSLLKPICYLHFWVPHWEFLPAWHWGWIWGVAVAAWLNVGSAITHRALLVSTNCLETQLQRC